MCVWVSPPNTRVHSPLTTQPVTSHACARPCTLQVEGEQQEEEEEEEGSEEGQLHIGIPREGGERRGGQKDPPSHWWGQKDPPHTHWWVPTGDEGAGGERDSLGGQRLESLEEPPKNKVAPIPEGSAFFLLGSTNP